MTDTDSPPLDTLTLSGLDGRDVVVSLRLPSSFARRWAVAGIAARIPPAAGAAALGLAWNAPRGRAPRAAWTGDPALYGEAVIDDLMGRGLDYAAVCAAGMQALLFLLSSLGPKAEEVDKAEDFSAAPTGA